jgi:hypothetical protein
MSPPKKPQSENSTDSSENMKVDVIRFAGNWMH